MNRRAFIPLLIVIFTVMSTALVAGAASDPRVLHSVPTAPGNPVKGAGNSPMAATGSGFTYQGRLNNGGNPANGQYDFTFNLYDAVSGGNLIAGPVTVSGLAVTDGLFTVSLDFGAGAFSGDARWLDIAVRPAGNGSYTPLAPRQPLSAAPYALSLMPGASITSTLTAPLITLSNTLGAGIYSQSSTNNGVTGISKSSIASGVYGENFSSGYGVAARNNSTNPYTAAIYGENVLTGTGVYGTGGAYGVIGISDNTGIYGYGPTYGVRAVSTTGTAVQATSSNGYGLYATTTSPFTSTIAAVNGVNNGAGNGVRGSSNGGYAVYGFATGGAGIGGYFTSTLGYGVYGTTSGTSSTISGVYGTATGSNGRGIIGEANTGAGAYGVWGKSTAGNGVRGDSTNGVAIYGSSVTNNGIQGHASGTNFAGTVGDNSGNGDGVFGQSAGGIGVHGNSLGTAPGVSGTSYSIGVSGTSSGASPGVYGVSSGSHGVKGNTSDIYSAGVYGGNTSGHGYGVYAQGGTADGIGIYGVAGGSGVFGQGGGNGVEGHSTNGIASGVYGDNFSGGFGIAARASVTGTALFADNPGGVAGNFRGNVSVQGTVSKGGGSFKIDDPIDPANKYLYHSFVESPDMMNIYNGNVTLDGNGETTVKMPAWFEALNMEFRYQLTAMGAPGPNLYVAQEIKDNQFKIAGGKPGSKVSWQVTGIRHDPFANAHRIPVEENKTADDKGKYLYPTEQGKPESQGIGYAQSQDLASSAAKPQAPVAPSSDKGR